jgi:ABC-2 type transport system ATP-binding protein
LLVAEGKSSVGSRYFVARLSPIVWVLEDSGKGAATLSDRHADAAPLSRDGQSAPSVILDVRDLSVAYGTRKAVDGVSLQIARGEIFGLLGPHGSGKTTTLSAIEGVIEPQSGTMVLDGVDIRRHPAQAKAKLGVQHQATGESELTVRQIVKSNAALSGIELSTRELAESLELIGLEDEATTPLKALSGEQQASVGLYIAVIHEPVLLLLDEPTAGLDPHARRRLWARIEYLRRHGESIMLTTQSMEEAQTVCDRVGIIDHGALLTTETPQNLIAKHRDDSRVRVVARGPVTLEDVFVGLTGS